MNPIELLRIALGSDIAGKISLSETECKELYSFAQKQSLIGVLFDGIERIYNDIGFVSAKQICKQPILTYCKKS